MQRRFNFTGRKKINQGDITIRIVQSSGHISFDADLRLSDYSLAADAFVFVEAYRSVSTLWKRFPFGRVGALTPPPNAFLDEFGHAEGILFRVKVTSRDDHSGRLLAEADRIRPRLPGEVDDTAEPILKTFCGDIGSEPWRLTFDDDMPQLLINRQIGDWESLARDPTFRSLVAPAVMRAILFRILIIDAETFDEDDDGDWRNRWLRFSESLPGSSSPPTPVGLNSDTEEVERWIDDAVDAFSNSTGLLNKLLQTRDAQA